jgi:hypothetical protein
VNKICAYIEVRQHRLATWFIKTRGAGFNELAGTAISWLKEQGHYDNLSYDKGIRRVSRIVELNSTDESNLQSACDAIEGMTGAMVKPTKLLSVAIRLYLDTHEEEILNEEIEVPRSLTLGFEPDTYDMLETLSAVSFNDNFSSMVDVALDRYPKNHLLEERAKCIDYSFDKNTKRIRKRVYLKDKQRKAVTTMANAMKTTGSHVLVDAVLCYLETINAPKF